MNLRDDDLNNLCIVADCISVCCTQSTRVNWIFFIMQVWGFMQLCAWLCDCVCFLHVTWVTGIT